MQNKEENNDYSFRIVEQSNEEYFNRFALPQNKRYGMQRIQCFKTSNKFKFESNTYVQIIRAILRIENIVPDLEKFSLTDTIKNLQFLVN